MDAHAHTHAAYSSVNDELLCLWPRSLMSSFDIHEAVLHYIVRVREGWNQVLELMLFFYTQGKYALCETLTFSSGAHHFILCSTSTHMDSLCCCCSVAWLCLTLRSHGLECTSLPCPSLSSSLLKLMSIESMMPSNHLILWQPPSPPALHLSQHQGLFQRVGSSPQVAKVLELQHRSFQWIFRVDIQDSLIIVLINVREICSYWAVGSWEWEPWLIVLLLFLKSSVHSKMMS